MTTLYLNDGEDRIAIIDSWVFIPEGFIEAFKGRKPTVWNAGRKLLCPRTVNGGTHDRPQDGFIKRWPLLPELAATIGRSERTTKAALRELEQLGCISVDFRPGPRGVIGLHCVPGQPATHRLSVEGDAAREAWRTFRGGKFLGAGAAK